MGLYSQENGMAKPLGLVIYILMAKKAHTRKLKCSNSEVQGCYVELPVEGAKNALVLMSNISKYQIIMYTPRNMVHKYNSQWQ